jgi:hypothetical protein
MNVFGRLPGIVLLTMEGTAVDKKEYKTFFFLLASSLLMAVVLYLARDRCTKAVDSLACRVLGIGRKRGTSEDGKDA